MNGKGETVVLVHGLYMHGLFMSLLARRLRRAGYRTVVFSYPSLRRAPAENARALLRLVGTLDAPVLHFLAHSLGGLVVRHLFARTSDLPPGRIVTLGTPHGSSEFAHTLRDRRLDWILGCSVEQGLLGEAPPWRGERELGSVAGTRSLGLGRLLVRLPPPSDGAVRLAETELPGMTDHIVLPVSHTGMLFARAVAEQACAFLASGRFRRP